MKDLRKIDPQVHVKVNIKRDEGAELTIPILRRTIKYDATGRKMSDTIINLVNGEEHEHLV
jgi:hypothetical protein